MIFHNIISFNLLTSKPQNLINMKIKLLFIIDSNLLFSLIFFKNLGQKLMIFSSYLIIIAHCEIN